MKRFFAVLLSALLLLPAVFSAYAAQEDHVVINQVYGASDDGYADHSFIELYNQTDKVIDLDGWSVQYRSSASGNHADGWAVLRLAGSIAPGGYYLIRCGAVTAPSGSYAVLQGNAEWEMPLHNKGLSVALLRSDTPLDDGFCGDVTAQGFPRPAALEDLAAVGGNDGTPDQAPPAYEGAFAGIQSKKKAIRRIGFADTDLNAGDFEEVNYSKSVSADKGPHAGEVPVLPVPSHTPVATTDKQYTGCFDDASAVKTKLIARYNAGAYSADGGSAEITAYNAFNGFAYSVNGVKGTLDCVDMRGLKNGAGVQTLAGTELAAAALAENVGNGFTYGDMTSVCVSPDGKTLALAMQDADYTKPGCVLFFACEKDGGLRYEGSAPVGIQPDMITFTKDGTKVLSADEGEPRQGYSAPGSVDPMGSVTVIDAETKNAVTVDFRQFDARREALAAAGVVLKKNTAPSVDLEPEYIAVSANKAYVALQEANAVAVLNLDTLQFENIFSFGFEDYARVAVDLDKSDGVYAPRTYEKIRGIRMPDGIAVYSSGGTTYLLSANEGDSRAWPIGTESDTNEIKSKTSPVNKIKFGGKVTWFDGSRYDGLEAGYDYVFGGRSFTVFRVTENGLVQVFDSGSDFERITARVLPEYFNCSNDTTEPEDRSGKKGPEPENVTVGTVDGHAYAFVGLERIGGVMIYEITDPQNAIFQNYFNSRDYSASVKDDVSPEGLTFAAAEDNRSGVPILLLSNEVSGTVSVMAMEVDTTPPELLNIENGKTYYVTKKVVVYQDDASDVTVTLNGETVGESFLLPGNREATYVIRAKDSVGNETVYTVYMKPISSLTEALDGISENTVTSANAQALAKAQEALLDAAGAFDENESTGAEWDALKAALDRCKALQNKIDETAQRLAALFGAAGEYSAQAVSEKDKAALAALTAEAKALLASENLTAAEREDTKGVLSALNVMLAKIAQQAEEPAKADGDDAEKPEEGAKQPQKTEPTAPKTGDGSNLDILFALLAASFCIGVSFLPPKRDKK